MEPSFQQSNQLIKIQADIDLKEREYKKLFEELENLQKAKGAAFKQHDTQIQHKKDELAVLEKKIDYLQSLMPPLQEAYVFLQNNVKRIKENGDMVTKAAEDAVKTVYSDADAIKREAMDLEANVKKHENEVVKRENEVAFREKRADERDIVQNALDKKLDNRTTELDNLEIESKKTVAKAQELLDDINRQLNTKRMQVQKLDSEIIQKTEHAVVIGNIAQRKLETVEQREKVVAQREVSTHAKTTELHNKELWLTDRESELRRAYTEVVQRGGNVKPLETNVTSNGN